MTRTLPEIPSTVGKARAYATDLLVDAGVPIANAERTAWALVLADCWGIGSHGLLRLPYYLDRLDAGGCRADAELRSVMDTGPLASFDGGDGLGHWQAWEAASSARDRCAEYGIGAVGVGGSSHCGALGIYTLPAVQAGYAALVLSNGPAVMPPWDGHRPVLSTSPIAAGFPAGQGVSADAERPAIVDLATSAVARGRIAQRAKTGEPLEPGWAFDADGAPTLDASTALRGMLAPLGGAKGYALAFAVEALTGALVGPGLSADAADMLDDADVASPQRLSHLVLVLDPARTSVDGNGQQRLDQLAASVYEAGGRVPGHRRRMPDEIDDDEQLP